MGCRKTKVNGAQGSTQRPRQGGDGIVRRGGDERDGGQNSVTDCRRNEPEFKGFNKVALKIGQVGAQDTLYEKDGLR